MASDQLKMVIEALRTDSKFEGGDIASNRAAMEAATAGIPLEEGTSVEPVVVAGVPCEWVAMPGSATDAAVLYLHGGAYTMGSLATHRRHVANLSGATGVRVLNVDYRLAPEHPHPAAVDDAVAVFRWLTTEGGVAPGKVVVAGDSAGGGLTLATLVALRDAGGAQPAGGALISPWTDLAMRGDSHDTRLALDPMCSRDSLAPSAVAYLGGLDPETPLASPSYADLAGLPPLVLHVGDHEVLLDDSLGVAERARAAGVDVDLWVAPEMIHAWHAFAAIVPESQEAVERLAAWIRTRIT